MIEKLKHLEVEIDKVEWGDRLKIDRLVDLLILIIKKSITDNDSYFNEIHGINNYFYNSTEARWNMGIGYLKNLVVLVINDIEMSKENHSESNLEQASLDVAKSNKVFLVHGHDEEIKQAVARFVEALGLEAVILHEKANEGKTIIEKFEKHSDVQFAIVLQTPDDLAYSAKETHKEAKFRSRQNVVLELGYFIGKLSRKNVMVIFRDTKNFDIPSDYSGVLYTPFDDRESWKVSLCRELNSAGFTVDTKKLL